MTDKHHWKAKPYSAEYDEMRAQIVSAAWDLIGEKGVAALRLDEVAIRANCARSSIYRYFSNKKELLIAVLIKWLFESQASLWPILEKIDDPLDRLVEGIYLPMLEIRKTPYFRDTKNDNNFLLASLALEAVPEIMSTFFDPYFEQMQKMGWLRENVSSEEAARWILIILISMGVFGSGGLSQREERAYLKKMLIPSLLKI
jgi:AcrR family transcriptional regulator